MTQNQNEPAAPSVDLATLSADELTRICPQAAETLSAAAREAGMKVERERIAAITGMAAPGQESLVEDMISNGVAAENAAPILLADLKARQGANLAALRAATPEPVGASDDDTYTEPAAATATAEELESQWRTEFAADATLLAEFGSAERYVIFKRNESRCTVNGKPMEDVL